VLNVCLDLVLIFGLGPVPAMGEAGAALATVASAALTCGIYLWRFGRLFGRPELPGWGVLKNSLQLGFPSGCQSVLNVLAFVVMNLALAKAGPTQLAASQIVLNIASLSFLPGFGVGEAGGVLVGRYLGAGERTTAVKALRSARWLAVWMMSACGLVFALKGEALASIFSQDAEVVELTGTLMLFAAAFQLFDAVAMVHLCALRSAGDTRFTLLLTTGAAWGLLVPATLLFGLYLGWGAKGAWLGITLEVAFLAVATGWRVTGLANGRVGRMDLLLGKRN
jgi:MATE family multidrug resistance protein